MRIFRLEIKRVLKTRITLILLLLSLLLSAVLAYLPTTFTYSSYTDESGHEVELTGLASIRYEKELQADITGDVTPEKVRQAVEAYQACLTEYGVENSYELPDGVYAERILPFAPLLSGVKEAFADPDTGMAPTVMEISPESVDSYYAACDERIASLMKMEQGEHPAAQAAAIAMFSNVDKPFVIYPGANPNVLDYQVMLSFLIMLFCTVIAAPVFTSDYQSGADDILRCTKHGRVRLGVSRTLSTLVICGIAFALCTAVYITVSNCLFGWECTKTSIQMLYSVVTLASMDMSGLQRFIALGSILSLLATVSLALFISSKAKSNVASLSLALMFCILPIIVNLIAPGELGIWLRCILPSAGASLQSSVLYAVADFEFLNVGQFAVWTPYAMIAFAAIEIPLFSGLAIHSYSTHRIR